jgi:hypothetical protein
MTQHPKQADSAQKLINGSEQAVDEVPEGCGC